MLSSQNCGKYLYGKWQRDRSNAMRDASTTNQDWLELTDQEVSGYYSDKTYEADTTPVDPETSKKTYDIRKNPKIGD